MRKVLIFGSNGLLGQYLVKRFAENYEIVGASVESTNYLQNALMDYYSVDITNRTQTKNLITKTKPDLIINAAAYTDVDGCEDEQERCWAVNVRAVENIIESVQETKSLLVHISTDYVFDGENGPYSETDQPNPRGNYARSKMAAENIIQNSEAEYLIMRTQVLFGTGQNVRPNFVTWVVNQLKSKKSVRIVTDQIGSPAFAGDVSEAIYRLVESQTYGLFHVSSPDSLSRYDFALKICRIFDLDEKMIERIKTEELSQKSPRPMNSSFVIDKLVNYSGWEPHSLDEALMLLKKEMESDNG